MTSTPGTQGRPRRRPTMADVAKEAGVSRTLVSFILDGKPGASPETKERVLDVAQRIGYQPDSAARLLARGRSRTLGVLMDVQQLFEADLVTAIYPAAEALGYDVLLSANLPDRAESVPIEALLSHRCGGLILLGPTSGIEYLSDLSERAPVVVVGRRLAERPRRLATVRTDDEHGIELAVEYLYELGHRSIHHVDGGSDPGGVERRGAYQEAMRSRGLSSETRVIAGAHDEAAGANAARAMLAAETALPTAVLASNDRCALGLLDVFTRAGVNIPGELSLIGFDDSALSDNPRIDLTTVHQDARALADHAVRLAVSMLDERTDTDLDVVLEPSLVVRGTTAAPRSAP